MVFLLVSLWPCMAGSRHHPFSSPSAIAASTTFFPPPLSLSLSLSLTPTPPLFQGLHFIPPPPPVTLPPHGKKKKERGLAGWFVTALRCMGLLELPKAGTDTGVTA